MAVVLCDEHWRMLLWLGHVRPGAEAGPVAGKDDGPRRADVHERLGELRDRRGVEGVARLGARERQPQDVPVAFDPQRAHDRRA